MVLSVSDNGGPTELAVMNVSEALAALPKGSHNVCSRYVLAAGATEIRLEQLDSAAPADITSLHSCTHRIASF